MSQAQTLSPESYWQRAVYLPLMDHLIQEMNDRLLSQEDRPVSPPKKTGRIKKRLPR